MGLLDDAIREHLELKRTRGADPTEVEREEREALGSPRRGQFAEDPDPDAPPGAVAAGAVEDETPLAEQPVDAEDLGLAEPPEAPPELDDEPPAVREEAWLDERDEVPPTEALERRRHDRDEPAAGDAPVPDPQDAEPAERGRARGDAGVPPGDPGARPAVVRAEAAAQLRLGQVAPPAPR